MGPDGHGKAGAGPGFRSGFNGCGVVRAGMPRGLCRGGVADGSDALAGGPAGATGPPRGEACGPAVSVVLRERGCGQHRLAGDLPLAVHLHPVELLSHRVAVVAGAVVLDEDGAAAVGAAGLEAQALDAQRWRPGFGKTLAIVAHSPAVQSLIEFYNLAAWFGDPLVVPAA